MLPSFVHGPLPSTLDCGHYLLLCFYYWSWSSPFLCSFNHVYCFFICAPRFLVFLILVITFSYAFDSNHCLLLCFWSCSLFFLMHPPPCAPNFGHYFSLSFWLWSSPSLMFLTMFITFFYMCPLPSLCSWY